jgi:hypothetical protein
LQKLAADRLLRKSRTNDFGFGFFVWFFGYNQTNRWKITQLEKNVNPQISVDVWKKKISKSA